MYCSTCGEAVAQGLSYCNHCGARLSGAQGVAGLSETYPESLVWAIAVVFMAGLGCIIGLMAVMKNELNFSTELIVAFTIVSFALLVGVESVLIWMAVNRMRAGKEARVVAPTTERATKELDARPARSLPEHAPASMIEHTTRTLEPLYSERKSDAG